MKNELPADIAEGATLYGNEYAWGVLSFPRALEKAEEKGYACLGGQFQFRLTDGSTCEMYWLNSDSSDRRNSESWADYIHRSCAKVLGNFRKVMSEADFSKEAKNWKLQIDPVKQLVFVGYFVAEEGWANLSLSKKSLE